jgi:hypothetical protein
MPGSSGRVLALQLSGLENPSITHFGQQPAWREIGYNLPAWVSPDDANDASPILKVGSISEIFLT